MAFSALRMIHHQPLLRIIGTYRVQLQPYVPPLIERVACVDASGITTFVDSFWCPGEYWPSGHVSFNDELPY